MSSSHAVGLQERTVHQMQSNLRHQISTLQRLRQEVESQRQNADLEVVSIAFRDELKGEYKRNNKSKGRKHLRCFPDCKPGGHVDNNYCGRPITVDVTYRMAEHVRTSLK